MYLSTSRAADAATDAVEDPATRGPLRAVPGTVIALGLVSLVTDVSAEMVTAVLPLYLVAGLGMSPLAFGALDGLHQGATALLRLVGGRIADRTRRRELVAGAGYTLSAACKGALLVAATPWSVATVLAADRAGKGLRTAPRDALISLSCPPRDQGRAFGVHRALDTTGALLGPPAAFGVLMAAAGAVLPAELRTTGLAVPQTAQALARFAGSVGFGAAWTVWGPGPALAAGACGLLLSVASAGVLAVFRGRGPRVPS